MKREDYLKEYPLHQDMRERVRQDKNRLHYHLMPPTGWMNDPNGLCQFKGENHIYFQYTPFLAGWGTKLWGHYITKDWISYQIEEPFLYPDTAWDRDGVYSGSAIAVNDEIHYFYTGNVKLHDKEDYDYIMNGREQNTIHVVSRDGRTILKKELVLTNDDYPSDMSKHVRDPKVFEKNGTYYMVLGARDGDNEGCALLYCSSDLEQWTYVTRISADDKWGYMWECPDMFELDGQTFMTLCPQGVPSQEHAFQNVYQCGYFPIKADFAKETFQTGQFCELDKGFDIYAGQTFQDEQGRRIFIAWMGIPDADYSNEATVAYDWIHALTMPRVLTNRDGRIYQSPLEEMKQLRTKQYLYDMPDFKTWHTENCCFEMNLQFDVETMNPFSLQLREDVCLNYREGIVSLELGTSGYGRKKRTAVILQIHSISVFSDTSSLEIFFNNGETVMTTRVYSNDLKQDVYFKTPKPKGKIEIFDLSAFEIKV